MSWSLPHPVYTTALYPSRCSNIWRTTASLCPASLSGWSRKESCLCTSFCTGACHTTLRYEAQGKSKGLVCWSVCACLCAREHARHFEAVGYRDIAKRRGYMLQICSISSVGQNRIYAPCMTVYLVISLPKNVYTVYIWFWPTLPICSWQYAF